MGYFVECNKCGGSQSASEIVNLIKKHTDKRGDLICQSCGSSAYVHRKSPIQGGGHWERYIRTVIPFKTQFGREFVPYVFLLSNTPKGKITDIHFNYYKDLRPAGRLKHGHGPGGAPVFGKAQLLSLVQHAVDHGIISGDELSRVAKAPVVR